MRKNFLQGALISAFILSSCGNLYTYEYSIVNKSKYAIEVYYHTLDKAYDTTLIIAPGKEQLIFVAHDSVDLHRAPYSRVVEYDIDTISITCKGRETTKNYIANNSWEYSYSTKMGNRVGWYTAYISNGDFTKGKQ